ncbi:MAG TPA: hypothetical protein VLF61_02820 [Rhabdochlamydiaceae bacterium]|nr:hypothetical protein [Rhabdochlamydiaceae bacterium]
MAKNRKKESPQSAKKKKVKEGPTMTTPAVQPKSKWQEFISKHAVSKQQ